MLIQDGQFHLTYCTNIHPAENWAATFSNLVQYCLPLKARLSPYAPFGIGLRLSNLAATELLEGKRLNEFRAWLDDHQLYVFTLNGFPYGVFHHQPVKDRVYSPDWNATERLAYTYRLSHILAALLPEGVDGSISTLPISYRPWLRGQDALISAVYHGSCLNIAEFAAQLAQIRKITGKCLHLNLEPEPDCLLESSDDLIRFYEEWLLPVGAKLIAERMQCSFNEARRILHAHVRVCYDTCHFAVAYESPEQALQKLEAHGIGIGKVQVSSALKVVLPEDVAARQAIAHRLAEFADPTYLHQVVVRTTQGINRHYMDLDKALPDILAKDALEWRIHFHVPVFAESFDLLSSTQSDLAQALRCLKMRPLCRHLEIETYTWSVLPASSKSNLLESIEREYAWVMAQLAAPVTAPSMNSCTPALNVG